MTARVNLVINQGSSFLQEVQISDQNGDPLIVTSANGDPIYTAAAQARKSYQAINAASFETSLSNGVLTLSMSSNATGDITAGRYVYDVELTSNNAVFRILEGIATIRPQVTKI